MVKMKPYIGFYRKISNVCDLFWNFYQKKMFVWRFPDDDGTDSHRKGYTGGISMKKYMMIILVTFCNFLKDLFFDPGGP